VNLADLVQTVSLATVATSIVLSALQNRSVAAQTREVARQSTFASAALSQSAHQTIVRHGSGVLANLLTSEPDLLSWFLTSRGIPLASPEENKRRMFMFLRMEVHEANYLAYLDHFLPDEVWLGWERVVRLDVATPEFQTIWGTVGETYSLRFAVFIDELIKDLKDSENAEG
jgi:hypothetical protein